jgi:DNA-binding transcriptional ArsR family regulator
MTMNKESACLFGSGGSGNTSSVDAAVALFRSLSDTARLAIVRRLSDGEARVVDLTGELGLAQSTVSAHVACLRDCGLVIGRPEGRQMFYSLSRPEVMDLLASAETLLTATGNTVVLCPQYGTDRAVVRDTRIDQINDAPTRGDDTAATDAPA